MRSKRINILVTVFLLLGTWTLGQGTKVRHDHDPWGACEGELVITEQGIEFQSEKEDHNRIWSWNDIQTVDRLSTQQFSVLTYKDRKLLLGRDQPYDFTVLEGDGLSDAEFDLIKSKFPRAVVDRIVKAVDSVEYEVPVKHLHTFGGCEGILRFGKNNIVYETDHAKDARSWRRDREVAGIWSTGRYDLEIQVYERDGGDFARSRNFRFQLKEALDETYYTKLRRDFLPAR